MGVNLVLKYKDLFWALYRSHNYKIDGHFIEDNDEWEWEYFDILHRLQSKMSSQIGYIPKDREELEDMNYDGEIFVQEIVDDIVKLGVIKLLLELKEEGFEYKEE